MKIQNILKYTFFICFVLFVGLFTVFVNLSIYFRLENSYLSLLSICIFSLSFIYFIRFFRFSFIAWILYITLSLFWFFWYGNIKASNDRIWHKNVAVLSYATINNNLITVHNIRHIKYITEEDYQISYYDETFDLHKLDEINFIASYWMGKNIAHTFLSFSFSDDKHLAISIEARKELDESYSIIKGLFKDNELYYVVADESDLIGVRTNIRKNPPEDVYMYQIKADLKDQQEVFLNYIHKLNELKKIPEFYNTLTLNCTTSIWNNTLINYPDIPFSWEIVISGYTAHYLYRNNLLKRYGLNFEELEKKAYINPLVNSTQIDATYSFKIRNK